VMYSRMLGTPGLPDLIGEAKEQMHQLKNAVVKRAQTIEYHRIPFGSSGQTDTNNVFFAGWM